MIWTRLTLQRLMALAGCVLIGALWAQVAQLAARGTCVCALAAVGCHDCAGEAERAHWADHALGAAA